MLYKNGVIHTMAGTVLQHGYFREKDGLIEEVGAMPPVPREGRRALTWRGRMFTPA